MAIGLIASSSLTHATPASFIAHVPQRSNMEAIAQWFTINTPDLAIGGGMKYFNHRTTDTLNLCEKLQQKGCRVTQLNEGSLSQLNPKPHSPFFWFAAEEEPESAEKGRDYLPIAAELAGPFLKKRSDKGFFLMLEGSQIDWACHKNDAKNAINEMLDFDACIGAILEFAHADGETLVIVTADHETGGMAIAQGSVMDSLTIHYTSDKHTASMVPVFAYGPGASQFSGIYDNTDIFHKVQRLMQLKVPKNVPRK
jgi:alkaline phosphatase